MIFNKIKYKQDKTYIYENNRFFYLIIILILTFIFYIISILFTNVLALAIAAAIYLFIVLQFLKQLVLNPPQMILDNTGIIVRELPQIYWNEIEIIDLISNQGFGIKVKNKENVLARQREYLKNGDIQRTFIERSGYIVHDTLSINKEKFVECLKKYSSVKIGNKEGL